MPSSPPAATVFLNQPRRALSFGLGRHNSVFPGKDGSLIQASGDRASCSVRADFEGPLSINLAAKCAGASGVSEA